MSCEAYETYLNDPKGFPTVQKTMREHFAKYPECECMLWCPRSGGFSDINEWNTCTRCEVEMNVITSFDMFYIEENKEHLSEFIIRLLQHEHPENKDLFDEDEQYYELCECCFKEIESMVE